MKGNLMGGSTRPDPVGSEVADGTRRSAVISRRSLLVGMAAFGLAACIPKGTWRGVGTVVGVDDPAPVDGVPQGLFALGVASGDPTPGGVVLWTRLAPSPLAAAGGMPDQNLFVRWQVANDDQFQDLVADGIVMTSASVANMTPIICAI